MNEEIAFNDGLIKVGNNPDNGYEGYSFQDINGEKVCDSVYTEMGYQYNLGYFLFTDGVYDININGYKDTDMIFVNAVTGEKYYFDSFLVNGPMHDDGSFVITEIDEGNPDGYRNHGYYKAQLKKPAIVTVFLNGNKIKFDQLPVIEEGRNLVPARFVADCFGVDVQ